MIHLSLVCPDDHEFEGWFSSSADFETQRKRGLIACPSCGTTKVGKALMAPSVSTGKAKEAMAVATMDGQRKEILSKMRELRDAITANADNVGKEFPEEARKIHYGEVEQRAVYGEATREDVESLLEEGVGIAPLPVLPDNAN